MYQVANLTQAHATLTSTSVETISVSRMEGCILKQNPKILVCSHVMPCAPALHILRQLLTEPQSGMLSMPFSLNSTARQTNAMTHHCLLKSTRPRLPPPLHPCCAVGWCWAQSRLRWRKKRSVGSSQIHRY